MQNYKQALALGILALCGHDLSEEEATIAIDLQKEYDLIKEKKSNLSAHQRNEVVYAYDSITMMKWEKVLEMAEAAKETE